ncbi:MAG TPA: hypothetical protein VFH78_07295 [Candidatus Thermoplasmatota archaeon]|nr:hypothetical protein [Candidatus Thermoplasmatota archaeon]
MVSKTRDPAARAKWWAETKMDLKWATALLFVLILAVSGYLWNRWNGATDGTENLADVTNEIFSVDGLVVPFEVLGLLLLAALIGGIVIAIRDPEGEA